MISGLRIMSGACRSLIMVAKSRSFCSGSRPKAVADDAEVGAEHVDVPTKLTPRAPMTSWIGLPMVLELLPANRRATGALSPFVSLPVALHDPDTISEPESPPALKVVLLITTWLV